MDIKIKYFDENISKVEKIFKGDWIDLRVSRVDQYIEHLDEYVRVEIDFFNDDFVLLEGNHYKIWLGIGMELPEGWEAHTAPRGSTFRKHGLIQTNSVGVVDCSYSGDKDEWFIPVYATDDTMIEHDQRLFQFRLMEVMPDIEFTEVPMLGEVSRGGDGSTGSTTLHEGPSGTLTVEEGDDDMVFSIDKYLDALSEDDDVEHGEFVEYMRQCDSPRGWQIRCDGKTAEEMKPFLTDIDWMVPRQQYKPYK